VVKVSGEKGFLSAVIEELKAAADEEAKRIIAAAEEEARRIVEEAKAKAEALREERRKRREEELKQRMVKEIALKRFELKKRFWNELYTLAEKALDKALEEAFALLKRQPGVPPHVSATRVGKGGDVHGFCEPYRASLH
jgi:cell division septum initiation protein DivIVA